MLRAALDSALASARGLPRAFWFLWLGALINRLGGFVVPFLALYLTQERGFAVERAGLAASLFGVGALCAAPLGGWLSDRFGRRPTMVLGLGLGAVAMVHLGLARAPWHVELAAFLVGLVGDLYRPAVWAAVADQVPAADRARAFGLLYWAINLGFAGSALLAGALAAGGFWVLFLGDAATSLIMAFVVWRFVPESRPVRAPGDDSPHPSPFAPLRDGVLMPFVLLSFALALIFMQFLAALPLDMRASGVSPRTYGFLIALNGIEIVLLQPFALRALAGRRRSRVLALSALLAGAGFGLTALARTPLAYGLTITLWTLGEILMAPVTSAIVSELAPAHLRGSYQGMQQMSWGAAFCIAPALGTFVLGRGGSAVIWTGCLVLGLVAAAAHLAIGPARGRRLAALHGGPARAD